MGAIMCGHSIHPRQACRVAAPAAGQQQQDSSSTTAAAAAAAHRSLMSSLGCALEILKGKDSAVLCWQPLPDIPRAATEALQPPEEQRGNSSSSSSSTNSSQRCHPVVHTNNKPGGVKHLARSIHLCYTDVTYVTFMLHLLHLSAEVGSVTMPAVGVEQLLLSQSSSSCCTSHLQALRRSG
jgi:hypothetical protein